MYVVPKLATGAQVPSPPWFPVSRPLQQRAHGWISQIDFKTSGIDGWNFDAAMWKVPCSILRIILIVYSHHHFCPSLVGLLKSMYLQQHTFLMFLYIQLHIFLPYTTAPCPRHKEHEHPIMHHPAPCPRHKEHKHHIMHHPKQNTRLLSKQTAQSP